MTNKKATKRALTLSIISMLICVVMLAGTTFAWFTDSVTSGVNQIVAGNLDVDVVTDDGNSIAGKAELFDVDLWEPGVVAYENLTVKNLGTLALKYKLLINFDNENYVDGNGLSTALRVGVVDKKVTGTRDAVLAEVTSWSPLADFEKSGTLLPGTEVDEYTVVIWWEPSANDNNWNVNNGKITTDGKPLHIDLGVKLVATQVEHEDDSFGNDYDKDATFNYGKTNVGPNKVNVLSDGKATYDEATKTYKLDVETVAQGGYNATQGGKYYAGYTVNVAGYGENATVSFDKGETTVVWKLADEERDGFINNGVHQQWTSVGTSRAYRYDIDGDGVTDFTVLNDVSKAGVQASNADELKNLVESGVNAALTSDVTTTSTITVPATGNVILDLNGNNLSYAVENTKAAAIINNKGNLNIVGDGTISFVAANPDLGAIPAYATNTITNTGSLTIGEGVTVTNGSEGGASYAVDNHGTFVLDGGILIGDRCALRVAKFNQDNVSFVMNSGLVKAKTPAWIQLPGSDSNVAPKISVEINGGTFQSTKATSEDNNVLYTYSYGNSHANTKITINGGEFLGGTVSIGSGYKGDAPTLNITGGTFEYDVLQWLAGDTSNVLYAANK